MSYVPERGDAIWINFNPQAGHEQDGRRPAIVLSPQSYNGRVSLCLLCPTTNKAKGYPLEVLIPADLGVTGVVLSDQAKNLDWRVRNAEFAVQLPEAVTNEVLKKLKSLL